MDKIDRARRSENMRRIRSENTRPELLVRKLIWRLGYRYRLHWHRLPGTPDVVFPSRMKAIYVHGCFWHQHGDTNCKCAHVPQSRLGYWLPKLKKNAERDQANQVRLGELGWEHIVIWECQVDDTELLTDVIREFLR